MGCNQEKLQTSFVFQVKHMPGRGYYVEDETGGKVSEYLHLRQQAVALRAEMQRRSDTKAKRGPRPCMRCSREFPSDGIHNRLCGTCRHSDAGPVAMGWARPQRRGDGAAR